jgi:sialic acid synthase SpsE
LLIAEIGVNHDGDVDLAARMVREASAAGFDAVKFQYWIEDELLARGAVATAPYQGPGDQHALLRRLALPLAALARLRDEAAAVAIGFIVTPDGERACTDVVSVGVDALKIGSGDADNPWLIERAVASGRPMIVSTGMMTEDELRTLAHRLDPAPDVTILHCVSAYPTPIEDARLNRMGVVSRITGRPVGFSDHTLGVAASAAAVALGAVAIEKHVTWSVSAPGPDHAMSLPLSDAASWVAQIRAVAAAMRSDAVSEDEQANRAVVRKGLYLTRSLPAGAQLTATDLAPLRPIGNAIAAGSRDDVVGRRLRRDMREGDLLSWEHLE